MFEVITRNPFSAEIKGLDLKRPDPAMAPEMQVLLTKHRVLVFRDVKLSPEEQVNFISLFGRVSTEVVGEEALHDPAKLFGKVTYVTSKPNEYISGTNEIAFHADYAFYGDGPIRAISLHGVEIGAEDPTIFADMIVGARLLPPALLEQLRTLEAVKCTNHVIDPTPPFRMSGRIPGADYGKTASIHPAVVRHPVTGEEVVNVCEEFTSHFCGWTEADSHALIAEVGRYVYAEENLFRHQWRTGDLIIWDNCATQHARGEFTPGATRHLQRVMVHPWDGAEAEERTPRVDVENDPRWMPVEALTA